MERSNSVVSAPLLRDNESKDAGSGIRRSKPGSPTNKCSCGQIICVGPGEMSPPRSPRHQSVFNKLYRDRVKKQIRCRELATKLVENEAQESTYMPVTNNLRRQKNESSSSLSGIVNRENRAEKMREHFKERKICMDCLKNVKMGAGPYLMEAKMSTEEVSAQPSQEGSFEFGTDLHPQREIIVSDLPATTNPKSMSHSFRQPSSKDEILLFDPPALVTQEGRNDESASRKAALPPRVPCDTSAFSFDIVSPISSLGSDDSGSRITRVVPSIHAQDISNYTPKLESFIQKIRESVEEEMREEAQSKATMEEESKEDASKTTASSTSSCGTPLRLLSYLEVDLRNTSLKSFPFDEKSEEMSSNERLNTSDANEQTSDETSQKSAISLSSILDRDPFTYEEVKPDKSEEMGSNQRLKTSDANEQTGDETSPKSAYSLSSILDRDSFTYEEVKPDSNDEAERNAADLAYVGCEIDPTAIECIDPCDNKKCGTVQPKINNSPKNESVSLLQEKSMNGSHDKHTALVDERDWIDQLTDCLMCEKSAPTKLPGSQHDLNLTLSHSASDEAVKKATEGSNAVSYSYSTKCHSIDLTPPKDWDNSRKDELTQALSNEEDWVDRLATCASPSNKRRVAVQEQNWLERSLDQVTEFATCGMLK